MLTKDPTKVTRVMFQVEGGAYAIVQLLWESAPQTCEAITKQLPINTFLQHGRCSGCEALCITQEVIPLGPENATTDLHVGQMLFTFEPKGCCSHATEDASEIAWLYRADAQPSRFISKNGDPTNQTAPFVLDVVPMNVWGQVILESGFYDESKKSAVFGRKRLVIKKYDQESKL